MLMRIVLTLTASMTSSLFVKECIFWTLVLIGQLISGIYRPTLGYCHWNVSYGRQVHVISSNESSEEPNEDSEYEEEESLFIITPDNEDDEPTTTNYPSCTLPASIVNARLGDLRERIRSNQILNERQKDALIALVEKYADCFGVDYEHLQQTNITKFHVDTGNAKPIYHRPYSFLTHSEKEFMRRDLEKMVAAGILVSTTYTPKNAKHGGWSFPCRCILKKTGDKRLVSNFSSLNNITVRDT